MRILIDGSAIALASTRDGAFWAELAVNVTHRLNPEAVFLLNRCDRPSLQEPLHNLFAPPVDLPNSLIEDRRLVALCSELAIDLFISTGYTSAGAKVFSVFLALDSMAEKFQANPHLRQSGVRAARLASVHIAVSEKAAEDLSEIADIPLRHCIVRKSTESIAQGLAEQYRLIPDAEIEDIRRREEEKTSAEAERVKLMEQAQAEILWNNAILNSGRLPLIPRVWQAVRSVQRYPEYLRRILQ